MSKKQKPIRDKNTMYTYYQIDFEDWGEEYDSTIVETLEGVLNYLKIADIYFDDSDRKTEVKITGIGMTKGDYDKWLADAIENMEP